MEILIDMFELEWDIEREVLNVYREVFELNRPSALAMAIEDAELIAAEGSTDGLRMTYMRAWRGDLQNQVAPTKTRTMMLAKLAKLYTDDVDPLGLMPELFTVHQLRKMHEAVRGTELLKDTFRRQMVPSLVGTGMTRSFGPSRPAELFRMAS